LVILSFFSMNIIGQNNIDQWKNEDYQVVSGKVFSNVRMVLNVAWTTSVWLNEQRLNISKITNHLLSCDLAILFVFQSLSSPELHFYRSCILLTCWLKFESSSFGAYFCTHLCFVKPLEICICWFIFYIHIRIDWSSCDI